MLRSAWRPARSIAFYPLRRTCLLTVRAINELTDRGSEEGARIDSIFSTSSVADVIQFENESFGKLDVIAVSRLRNTSIAVSVRL